MIQPPLEICARRPAQGAMPLLDSTYIEYEQMNEYIAAVQRDGEIHTKMSS
jgi:hypothetical protein